MDRQITRRRAGGFTLIEVMVSLVIVAILSALAYPSYTESVRKGKRASAKAKMAEVAGRLQQFYSEGAGAATYTATLTDLQYPSSLYSEAKGHLIKITAGSSGIGSSYVIVAEPVDPDLNCGNLTLDNLGTMLPASC